MQALQPTTFLLYNLYSLYSPSSVLKQQQQIRMIRCFFVFIVEQAVVGFINSSLDSGGTTRVPQGYADGFGDALHYSRSAFWAFNTVANFIYPRLRPMPASPGIRCLYIAGFRGHFSSLDGFLSFFLFEILDL